MKDFSARPPGLPRIFDHKRYAEAAHQDHDERARDARRFVPARRHRDIGAKIGYAVVGAALLIALAVAITAFVGIR